MSFLLAPKSRFARPSLLYVALTQPLKLILRAIDFGFSQLQSLPHPDSPPVRIVCLSDTHCQKAASVPDGDLLIHAGDLTKAGTPAEIQAQIDWLNSLPHQHKVAIAGNHDTFLDPRSRKTLAPEDRDGSIDWKDIQYLQHSSISLSFHNGARKLNIYGAPQIISCGRDDFAFQYPEGSDAWSETIPTNTDVLVTHSPPKFHLDLPSALGCEYLLAEVWRVQPRVQIFGHIHDGKMDTFGWLKGGREVARWNKSQRCLERVLARSDGLIIGLLDPRNWIDAVLATYYGIKNVIWVRVWGGKGPRPTIMVNAALMYEKTGRLGHEPQVVIV